MPTVVITAPTGSVLSAAELKSRLGVSDDDAIVSAMEKAAVQAIDGPSGWLGRALLTQTLEWRGTWCETPFFFAPLQSIVSVKYDDTNGVEQTISSGEYRITGLSDRPMIEPVYGTSWPSMRSQVEAFRIRYIAGYGAGTDVPEPIRAAIALQVRAMLGMMQRDPSLQQSVVFGVSSRTFSTDAAGLAVLDAAVKALLAPYRVFS